MAQLPCISVDVCSLQTAGSHWIMKVNSWGAFFTIVIRVLSHCKPWLNGGPKHIYPPKKKWSTKSGIPREPGFARFLTDPFSAATAGDTLILEGCIHIVTKSMVLGTSVLSNPWILNV